MELPQKYTEDRLGLIEALGIGVTIIGILLIIMAVMSFNPLIFGTIGFLLGLLDMAVLREYDFLDMDYFAAELLWTIGVVLIIGGGLFAVQGVAHDLGLMQYVLSNQQEQQSNMNVLILGIGSTFLGWIVYGIGEIGELL